MDQSVHFSHRALSDHWWFSARADIVGALLSHVLPSRALEILDIGSGAGSMLPMLFGYGSVTALETDSASQQYLSSTYGQQVHAIIKDDFQHWSSNHKFDVVTFFDVLEHFDDDGQALQKAKKHVREQGFIVGTVPAYQWLWSRHDDLSHHRRRYTQSSMRELLINNGLTPIRMTYFNTMLFPLILLIRVKEYLAPSGKNNFDISSRALNTALKTIFGSERHMLRFFNFPFGLSIFFIAKYEPSHK